MKEAVIAMRYARGLAQFANENGEFDQVRADLLTLRDLLDPDWGDISVPELVDFLNTPTVSQRDKLHITDVICEKMGIGPTVSEFLNVLIRHNRVALSPFIMRAYDQITREITGESTVVAESAQPLTDAEKESLRQALEKASGGKVRLAATVNPRLLGGLRLRLGDRVLDNTLPGRLKRLAATLG